MDPLDVGAAGREADHLVLLVGGEGVLLRPPVGLGQDWAGGFPPGGRGQRSRRAAGAADVVGVPETVHVWRRRLGLTWIGGLRSFPLAGTRPAIDDLIFLRGLTGRAPLIGRAGNSTV